jgi:hypothetical protein
MGDAVPGHFAEDVFVDEVLAGDGRGGGGRGLAGDLGGKARELGAARAIGRRRVVGGQRLAGGLAESQSGGKKEIESAHSGYPADTIIYIRNGRDALKTSLRWIVFGGTSRVTMIQFGRGPLEVACEAFLVGPLETRIAALRQGPLCIGLVNSDYEISAGANPVCGHQ